MKTVKEAANLLGLSCDSASVDAIQQVRLDAYKAGLMEAQRISSDVLRREASKYAVPDQKVPDEMTLSGLDFFVSGAICSKADNATTQDLRQ